MSCVSDQYSRCCTCPTAHLIGRMKPQRGSVAPFSPALVYRAWKHQVGDWPPEAGMP